GVLTLVVRPELARLDGSPPCVVASIPLDGRGQRRLEGVSWLPAERVSLAAVERIAAVVARPVRGGRDRPVRVAWGGAGGAGQHPILDFVAASDVVDLTVLSFAKDEVDGRAVVEDIEPISHVPAVAVERDRAILEGVGDEERDHLLRVLIGAEVVAAARDHD